MNIMAAALLGGYIQKLIPAALDKRAVNFEWKPPWQYTTYRTDWPWLYRIQDRKKIENWRVDILSLSDLSL